MPLLIGFQVAPASVLFSKPSSVVPAYMVFEFAGSMARAFSCPGTGKLVHVPPASALRSTEPDPVMAYKMVGFCGSATTDLTDGRLRRFHAVPGPSISNNPVDAEKGCTADFTGKSSDSVLPAIYVLPCESTPRPTTVSDADP